jgi:tripeptide aminopeptidase
LAGSASDRFSSPLAAELADDVLERFLRYVRIDTQAEPGSGTYPSTLKQLDLSRLLERELREIGVEDVRLDEHGYVLASLPASDGAAGPTFGLIAHVDTSPDASGTGVQPQVVRGYDGGDIPLPGAPGQVLGPNESALLRERVGHDIVTTDGTTLLGADDKAGVAEIMTAVRHLVAHPELRHPPLAIAFTVDEEVGGGTDHFDIDAFGAEFAYTVDGARAGELENETFAAKSVWITIQGRAVHPGTAKGKLVSAIKLGARLLERLPKDALSPETTDGREGFVHPGSISGTVDEVQISFIARDFDPAKLDEHVALLRRLADELAAEEPRARVTVEVEESYRNMRETIDRHPEILAAAQEAVRRAGLEPSIGAIRGGTDGSVLTAKGLPTPNIFTGGNEYHSVREWISVQDMAAAAATLVELAQVWAEPEWAGGQSSA